MKHWILTRATMQAIVENLDLGRMTLSAARDYFSAYGVDIKGNTKKVFIRNLAAMVMSNEENCNVPPCNVNQQWSREP